MVLTTALPLGALITHPAQGSMSPRAGINIVVERIIPAP
jgi:hypothetical protein